MSALMAKNVISEAVFDHLWAVYGSSRPEILPQHRRGAIIIIGMLTKDSRELIEEKISTLINTGFGHTGEVSLCTCLH